MCRGFCEEYARQDLIERQLLEIKEFQQKLDSRRVS